MISKSVRMIDVAKKAKVSRMAVSAVLQGTGNGSIRVGTEKRIHIKRIAQEMGYQPNRSAQQLAGKKSGIIAVMAGTWFYPVELRVFSWLQETANKCGYRMLAVQSDSDVTTLKDVLGELQGRGIEGLIYVAYNNEHQWPEVRELIHGIPHVVSLIGDLEDKNTSGVVSDVELGAAMAVQHLVERGRKKIVMVVEDITSQKDKKRVDGFRAEHIRKGLPFTENQICIATKGWELDTTSEKQWDELLEELISSRNADAIIADSDYSAVGLLKALRRKKVNVPEKVAVLGWGNEAIAPVFDPPISTVSYQIHEIVNTAMDILLGQSDQKSIPLTIQVEPKLFIRETT